MPACAADTRRDAARRRLAVRMLGPVVDVQRGIDRILAELEPGGAVV